ncbi:hypothetical protein Ancab_010448 [Ancistrocladus abbreviatus]
MHSNFIHPSSMDALMADMVVVDEQLIPGLPNETALECLLRVPHQFHSTLKLVCHSWRILLSNPSFYRERRRLATSEHLFCLIQPLPTPLPSSPPPPPSEKNSGKTQLRSLHGPPLYGLSIYNTTLQKWHRIEMMGYVIPMFCHCVALPDSGKVLLIGGWDPETLEPASDVLIIDLVSGFWRKGAKMAVARSFFACAVVGCSRVYLAGGHDGQKNALKSAEVYDVMADEWRALPDMAEERDECQGLCLEEGKFWVFSGYGTENQGRFRSDAECFDPESGVWSKIDGVWPFSNTSPRTTIANPTYTAGPRQWWWLAGEEQGGQMEVREFDWEEKRWKMRNTALLPNGIIGSSLLAVNGVGCGGGGGGIFVMGTSGRDDGRGGAVALMVERHGKAWRNIQAPSRFSGLPFSGSSLVI